MGFEISQFDIEGPWENFLVYDLLGGEVNWDPSHSECKALTTNALTPLILSYASL